MRIKGHEINAHFKVGVSFDKGSQNVASVTYHWIGVGDTVAIHKELIDGMLAEKVFDEPFAVGLEVSIGPWKLKVIDYAEVEKAWILKRLP